MGATRRGTYAPTKPDYRRNRFGGSPAGTASLPARVSTSAWWNQSVGKTLARDKYGSRDMAIELGRELWPQCPDLQDAFKLKKHHGRAEAFLIAAYSHASSGEPQGRLHERDPLSAILSRLARRKKGEESEPEPRNLPGGARSVTRYLKRNKNRPSRIPILRDPLKSLHTHPCLEKLKGFLPKSLQKISAAFPVLVRNSATCPSGCLRRDFRMI